MDKIRTLTDLEDAHFKCIYEFGRSSGLTQGVRKK